VLIVTKAPRLRSAGWAAGLGLLLAGAVGNLCDRLIRAPGIGRGAVVDFVDLQHFATLNIADSCLTCGAVLAVLLSLRGIPMTELLGCSRRDDRDDGDGALRALAHRRVGYLGHQVRHVRGDHGRVLDLVHPEELRRGPDAQAMTLANLLVH
jgi:signal peptidase II